METLESEILIVGAGGAGMSAAVAASADGKQVTIVDENPDFGGQIWRRGVDRKKTPPQARRLFDSLKATDAHFLLNTTVVDGSDRGHLSAIRNGKPVRLVFDKLIIASGARERFVPFPGWTLPNVFGAGGLQALVKGGMPIEGKRIIVAGTGPLLLAVSDYLVSKGARVLFTAEQAQFRSLAAFGLSLAGHPGKLRQAAALLLKSGRPDFLPDSYVISASGDRRVESVTIKKSKETLSFDCDILATGYHLIPNLELPLLLGLETSETGVVVDGFQNSSSANIFAAGESTGIGGIELACVEGSIAGHAASGNPSAAGYFFDQRRKLHKFAERLNRAFELRDELKYLGDNATIVCRCEDVRLEDLEALDSWREAKLHQRCGMGPCQGRICGPITKYLFGWKPNAVRPPLTPVRLKTLGENYK